MKNGSGRLLQLVVAAALLNAAPDGRANTYTLSPIRATIPDDDYSYEYEEFGYNNWEFNDYSEPSDDGDDESIDTQAECEMIKAKVSGTCDLANPPFLATNGCGSEGSAALVPDFLIVNMTPVYTLGPIFAEACNDHDVCYGSYPADKDACDMVLYTDMVEYARQGMTMLQWQVYRAHVLMQASLFSRALQSPFLAGASGEAFGAAQLEGSCRYHARKAQQAGCLE